MKSALWLLEALFILLPLCGCGYYVLCLWSARQFLRRRRTTADTGFAPPVSILKPLKGMDPEIYASLRSHCVLEYPEYEIIFGVSDPNDPAIATVKKLQSEFPTNRIQLIVCPKILGANLKVSNLAQMAREIFDLVRMNWNSADIRAKWPVTLSYARKIGGILDECGDSELHATSFRYFL